MKHPKLTSFIQHKLNSQEIALSASHRPRPHEADSVPLVVDLDGTLTFTDTLYESALVFIRQNPLNFFLIIFWLFQGKSFLKAMLAQRVHLNVESLPYNHDLLAWLKEEKTRGRRLVLCTATNENIANSVAQNLSIFDDVIASERFTNLKGQRKRIVLEAEFGPKGYDYVGDSVPDLFVWSGARKAIMVNPTSKLERQVSEVSEISRVFHRVKPGFFVWFRAVRLHQWLKNILLFVPLAAAHQIDSLQSWQTLGFAFFAFSFCASGVYIVNDLLDLESDRLHARKCHRPFASAVISIPSGFLLASCLFILSLFIGLAVGEGFFAWLVAYLLLTFAYSMALKRLILVDCLVLASLYTLRIVAGAAAVSIVLSFWLLTFSVFIFLSLAFVKRFAELKVQETLGNDYAHGRGYKVTDATLIQVMGVSVGYLAVLVLALYIQSETVALLYQKPEALWLAVPLILFWISWVWFKANRGEMHDDPIVFAMQDKTSFLVGLLVLFFFSFATVGLGVL